MNLEKTISVTLPSTKGKFSFQKSGENLEIKVVGPDDVVHDSATLSEADLRFLLKDIFPTKRKTREPKVPAANGGAKAKPAATVNK